MIAHARRRVNGHHTEASPTLARFVLVHPSIPGGGVVASYLAPVVDALTAVLATPESPHFWLDVERIRPDEMDALADLLGLHEVTIFDCLNEDFLVSDEKFERFPDYFFLIADLLNPVEGRWRTENVNVVVLKRGAITLRNNPFPELAALAAAARRNAAGSPTRDNARTRSGSLSGLDGAGGPDRVLLSVLELVLAHTVPQAADAADAADQLDHEVLTTERPGALLRDMALVRQQLAKLAQSLLSKREILASVCSDDLPVPQISAPTRVRLRAVLDQVVWKLSRVEAAQETLRGASANLFALVNLQVGRAANETNRVIKNLSLLLAITTPLTLVASVFGMNVFPLTAVHIVDRDKENWGLMIGLIAFMCGSTFLLLVLSHKYSMFGNLQIKRVLSLGDIGL